LDHAGLDQKQAQSHSQVTHTTGWIENLFM